MIRRLSFSGVCLWALVFVAIARLLYAGPIPTNKPAHYPDWWFERDVIPRLPAAAAKLDPVWPTDYPTPDDYAIANVGQAKHIAMRAVDELEHTLSVPASPEIIGLISPWMQSAINRDDYAALNQGQLKAVAAPFYDHLQFLGQTIPQIPSGQTYPWTVSTSDDDSYSVANLGQIKNLFSFNPAATSRRILKLSGDAQSGLTGQALPLPLIVQVSSPFGTGFPGVSVGFQITSGSGSLSTASAVTNAQGRASVVLTPTGEGGDMIQVRASIAEGSVDFIANIIEPLVPISGPGTEPPLVPPGTPNPGGSPNPILLDPSPNPLFPPSSLTVQMRTEELGTDSEGNPIQPDPTHVTVRWYYSGPSDISGYVVEMSKSGGAWTVIGTRGPTSDHIYKANLEVDARYEFRVSSSRGGFSSIPSGVCGYQTHSAYLLEALVGDGFGSKDQVAFLEFQPPFLRYYLKETYDWDLKYYYNGGAEGEAYVNHNDGDHVTINDPYPSPEDGELLVDRSYEYSAFRKTHTGPNGAPVESLVNLSSEEYMRWNAVEERYEYSSDNVNWQYNIPYTIIPHQFVTPDVKTATEQKWILQNYVSGKDTLTLTLSEEYTTEAFTSDVEASIKAYSEWDEEDGQQVSYPFYGTISLDWYLGGSYLGGAQRQLNARESALWVGRAKYRIKKNFTARALEECKWAEVWIKRDEDKAESEEAPLVSRTIVKNLRSWRADPPESGTPGGTPPPPPPSGEPGYSPEYEVKGDEAEEDGYYQIVRLDQRIKVEAPGGHFDAVEKVNGIPVYSTIDEDALYHDKMGREFTLDPHTMPGGQFRLSWTGSNKFRVYAFLYGFYWSEISSGYTYTPGTSSAPWRFAVIGADDITNGADFDLTVSVLDASSTVLASDSANFEFVAPINFDSSLPLDTDAGARFRKVALNGAPLSDSRPEASGESDQPAEETFIDALTTGLRHSTTDAYLTVPGADLVLAIRRNAASYIWNNRHGLRPHERPDMPFGPGWSASLAPTLRIANELDGRIYAYVTDEHGQSFRFLKTSSNYYIPLPNSQHESSAYLASFSGSSLTLTRKFGSRIEFQPSPILTQNLPADRWSGGAVSFGESGFDVTPPAVTSSSYYRAHRVIDRHNRRIVYEYPTATAFVPSLIYAEGITGLALKIQQNSSGRVTDIWDPRGFRTTFNYTPYSVPGGGGTVQLLTSVTNADTATINYDYSVVADSDQTPLPSGEIPSTHYHVDLSSITDAEDYEHEFTYEFDRGRSQYKNSTYYMGYYTVTGVPRQVTAVTLPGGLGTASFDNQSILALDTASALHPVLRADSVRRTVVTDAVGQTRTYTWLDPQVEEIVTVSEPAGQRPRLALYRTLEIEHSGLGSEKYIFAPSAGMALASATDLSGNTTQYAYTDAWAAPSEYRTALPEVLGLNGFYEDPTSTTNALGHTVHFTYQSGSRIMSSRTDELGHRTEWTVDGQGRRTAEKFFPAGSITPVRWVVFGYDYSSFPTFVSRTTVKKLTLPDAPDPTWVNDLVTENVPDAQGRLWKEIVDPSGLALTTLHTYDANGNRETTTDPRGKITKFFYDSRNRLQQVNYADGYNRQFFYDLRGNKWKELDEKGVATFWTYDARNRVKSQVIDLNGNGEIDDRPLDSVVSYTYTALGAPETVTDPRGTVTKCEYDALNRLWKKTEDFGTSPPTGPPRFNYLTTFEYDLTKNPGGSLFDSSSWKPTKVTDPRGFTTEITYSKRYQPLEEKVQYKTGAYAISNKSYDAAGRLETVTGPLTTLFDGSTARHVTHTDYDALGRVTSVTEGYGTALAVTTSTEYASTGLPHRVTDPLGRASDTEYDTAGRAVNVFAPAVADGITGVRARPMAETRYDVAGNISYTIDPLGRRTDYTYDDRNRLTVTQAPAITDATTGVSSRPTLRTSYDAVGNPIAVQDALGHVTNTEFDAARRPWRVTAPTVPLPDGATARPVTETTYDAAGKILTVEDAQGRVTTNTYDALGRLKTTTDAAGIVVTSDYDASGNRTDVWDGKNQRTRFAYDGFNRLITTTDPATRVSTFEYDAVHKIARVDSENRRTEYKYDGRGRVREVRYIGRSLDDRFFSYDALNRIDAVTEPGKGGVADVFYTYDELGRQLTETSGGLLHTYGYDSVGNRTRVLYAGGIGTTLISAYDALNRLSTLTETTTGVSGTRVTTYGYDLAGRRVRQQLPSGEVVLTRHDALGRSLGSLTTRLDGSPVLRLTQAHDLVGNVVTLTEDHFGSGALPPRSVANSYDAVNRLTNETTRQGGKTTSTTYGYDDAHNRISRSIVVSYRGQSTTEEAVYGYNNLNQLETATTGAVLSSYTYDFNGNRETRATAGQTDTYVYDYENRLVGLSKTTTGGTGTYAYVYDCRTRRVLRNESGVETRSVFSGGVSVADYAGTVIQARYIRGSDWGGGVGGLLYSLRDGQPSYKHYNGRGDIVAATDSASTATWRASYEAFGTRTREVGTTQDRQKANTKEEDPTGLLNEGFRYRDLETGTFITRDPLGFVDGPNMYAYVVQNPWSKFDPEGLQAAFDDNREIKGAPPIGTLDDLVMGGMITTGQKTLIENGSLSVDQAKRLRKLGNNSFGRLPKLEFSDAELAAMTPTQRKRVEGFNRTNGYTTRTARIPAEKLVKWVDEGGNLRAGSNPSMSPDAYRFQSGTPGARSSVKQGRSLAPYLEFTDDTGTVIGAKFDGVQGFELIDRKTNPFFSAKAVDEARRQAAVAKHFRLEAVYELPTPEAVNAANRFMKVNNIEGITVRLAQ